MGKKLSWQEAGDILMEHAVPVGTERKKLQDACGRILAAPVAALENVPPFDRSPYDGYALRSADTAGELPVTLRILEEDALPVLAGTLPVAEVLLLGLYAPGFLLGGTEKRPGEFGALALWLMGMCLGLAALCAAVVGCFGAEITARLTLPFFTLVRNLVFFRTLERMEALVVALWLFPDFLLSGLALFCAQHCLRLALGAQPDYRKERLTQMQNKRWVIWLGGAAAIAAGLLMAPNGDWLTLWSERIVPVGQYLAAGQIIIIYMVGKGKKRL